MRINIAYNQIIELNLNNLQFRENVEFSQIIGNFDSFNYWSFPKWMRQRLEVMENIRREQKEKNYWWNNRIMNSVRHKFTNFANGSIENWETSNSDTRTKHRKKAWFILTNTLSIFRSFYICVHICVRIHVCSYKWYPLTLCTSFHIRRIHIHQAMCGEFTRTCFYATYVYDSQCMWFNERMVLTSIQYIYPMLYFRKK